MKKLILFTFLFWMNFTFAQLTSYEKGEVFYRDGTSEKGSIKRKYSTLKFKTKNKKPIELTYKEVKKISINEDGEDFEYVYKIIKGKKKGKFKLLKVVIIGKTSLYLLNHETQVGNTATSLPFLALTYKGADFYIGKNESSLVDFIGANSIAVGRKNIRKGLIKYFKDCRELVKKLKNKEFKNKDIIKVIEFYNEKCN